MLIVIEGTDGSGKTTVCKELERIGYKTTKEPSSPKVPILKYVHKLIVLSKDRGFYGLLSFFFFIDHFLHCLLLLNKSMDSVIICDRYYPISNQVYRNGRILYLGPKPDLVIYFKVSPGIAAERILNRRGEGNYQETFDFVDDKIRRYEKYFSATNLRVVSVAADYPPEIVLREVLSYLPSLEK